MANEFIKKEIEKERTGANISPINVDIQSRFLINPTNVEGITIRNAPRISAHENLFLNTLEKIAKESEELKLTNEKNLLDIELKKKEIDFNTKWAQVPDRYGAKYEEYLKEYNNLLSSQKELINKNKYLTTNEKAVFSRNADISNYEGRSKILIERNKRHIIEQTEIAKATLEQYSTIGATYGMYDDEKARENYERMRDTIHKIAKLSGWSDEYTTTMLGKYIGGTEISRIENRVSEIQNDPNSSIYEKEKQINQILSYLNNKQGLEERVDLVMEHMDNIEDKERTREYLKVQLQGRSKTTIKGIKSAFNEFKRAKEREARYYAKQQELMKIQNEKSYEDDLFNKNAVAVASYQDDKKGYRNLSLGEFLSNPSHLEKVSNYGWDTYGDITSSETLKIVPTSAIQNLKMELNANFNNAELTTEQKYQPIYELANQISQGDEMIRNNILKDIGLQIKIDPTIIINGEKKPDYYKVANNMNKGKTFIDELEIDIENLNKVKKNKKFKQISAQFSSDKGIGDYMALQYITGEALKITKKSDLANNYDIAIKTFLNKNEINTNNINIASEFSTKRKDYKYSNLKDVRKKETQKIQQEPTKKETKSKIITSQSSAFGG